MDQLLLSESCTHQAVGLVSFLNVLDVRIRLHLKADSAVLRRHEWLQLAPRMDLVLKDLLPRTSHDDYPFARGLELLW